MTSPYFSLDRAHARKDDKHEDQVFANDFQDSNKHARASESCRRADKHLRQSWTFEDKTGKTGTIFIFLTQSDKVFAKIYMFYGIFSTFLCAKFVLKYYGCAKKITFKRSELYRPPSLSWPTSWLGKTSAWAFHCSG